MDLNLHLNRNKQVFIFSKYLFAFEKAIISVVHTGVCSLIWVSAKLHASYSVVNIFPITHTSDKFGYYTILG